MTPIVGYIREDGYIRFVYQVVGGLSPGWKTYEMPAEGIDSKELGELAAEEFALKQMRERRYGGTVGAIELIPAFPGI